MNNRNFNRHSGGSGGSKQFHRYTRAAETGRTNTSNTKSKKSLIISVSAIIGVALIVVVSILLLNINIGSTNFSITDSKVNLRNTGITSTDGLDRLLDPVSIDLRGNKLPASDVIALIEKFPECRILWSVPIGDNYIDCDKKEIAVPGMTADEVPLLLYFTKLKSIDARGLEYDVVEAINKLGLDCNVNWDIGIGNDRFSPDAESITIGDVPPEEIAKLMLFENLKSVDAKACKAYDALISASDQLPECEIVWSVTIGDFEVLSNEETLNFNRTTVEDSSVLDADFENLKYLPNLKTVDMCGCGVPSEKMAEWRNKYPEKKFVWEIYFGKGVTQYTVRTDIKVFSTLMGGTNPRYIGTEEMFRELFLYCTELRALDLGHNLIEDISLISNLKQLQAVILMDNPITDFSPLAELPELVFAEINRTNISDLSFVKSCPKLQHLDISETKVSDISLLYDCENLKYVILIAAKIRSADQQRFRHTRTDCLVAIYESQFKLYRNSPLRSGYRMAFKNYMHIETFEDWTNYTFAEGAELIEPSGYKPPEYYENLNN